MKLQEFNDIVQVIDQTIENKLSIISEIYTEIARLQQSKVDLNMALGDLKK